MKLNHNSYSDQIVCIDLYIYDVLSSTYIHTYIYIFDRFHHVPDLRDMMKTFLFAALEPEMDGA